MSLLSSTVKNSLGDNTLGAKIKRKSRRHRASKETIALEPEEPERGTDGRPQIEAGSSRQHTRRVSTISDEASSSRKRKTKPSAASGGSSRRTPTNLHRLHGTESIGPPSLAAQAVKRQSRQAIPSQEAYTAARRSLTSSASSIRPSNRKRLGDSQKSAGLEMPYPGLYRVGQQHNNNDEVENPRHFPSPNDWIVNNQSATRVTLPSRASKYRNLSAGANKKTRVRAVAVPQEIPDRPPSRQSHAFPTNLIDNNAFDAPDTSARRGRSSSSSSRNGSACSSSRKNSANDLSPLHDIGERPPSRYMVKAKRQSHQGHGTDRLGANSAGPLSRRGVVDKTTGFSCNQTHHDPKTDGFADVDESVPLPFRIKITTESTEVGLDSPSHTHQAPSFTSRKTSSNDAGVGHRWPSYGNQEQLLRVAMRDSNGTRNNDHSDTDAGRQELQWFGKDDQINNAHLFESIITLPNRRSAQDNDIDADATIDDLDNDSDDSLYRSRKVVGKSQQPQEFQPHTENHFPSRRAAEASKLAVAKTAISVSDNPELQWIRSSTNPFFVGSSSNVDYDSMDPDIAIEHTPLYSSEDLMTLAATEMSDLHLDDLGDASMPLAPPPSTSRGGSRMPTAANSPPLRTSLGKDFLSLFAK